MTLLAMRVFMSRMAIDRSQGSDNTDIEDFRSLKGKAGLQERGRFIAESPKIVQKVLSSSALRVSTAFLTPAYFAKLREALEARPESIHVHVCSKDEMERVVGYHLHQGVMLSVEIPKSRSLECAIDAWQDGETIVALDSIADAENMGAILRNCAAFGIRCVLIDDQSCDPYLRRSVRVSMGTIVDIQIIRTDDLATALELIKELTSAKIIGAALGQGSVPLSEVKPGVKTVIVFGSEGWGLRPKVAAACDALAEIPMADGIDSLNVAIANGIFLYTLSEAHRA